MVIHQLLLMFLINLKKLIKNDKKNLKKVFGIFIYIFLFFSCSNNNSEKTVEFKDFDISKLEPISYTDTKNNWHGKAYEVNDSLRKIVFFDRKNKIIKEDSIFYKDNLKYLINTSEIIQEKTKLKLIKITFLRKNKLQRHFLIKRFKMIYLICVDSQIEPNVFKRRRINNNFYCLAFKDIKEYLLNINKIQYHKYYFADYMTFDIFYIKGELFHNETLHEDWGKSRTPSASKFNSNYNNLYLDLDKIDDNIFIMGADSYEEITRPRWPKLARAENKFKG